MTIIIGITGTLGAGKGTITGYLQNRYGFKHFSVREFLSRHIIARGGEVNRDTLTAMGNELRAAHGERYFSEVLGSVYASGEDYVFESVRTPSEVAYMKQQPNTYLFAVDAPIELRYSRAFERASETDKIDFPTFVANEQREMTNTDRNKQNLQYCKEHADFVFDNSQDFDHLYRQIDTVMQKIMLPQVQ